MDKIVTKINFSDLLCHHENSGSTNELITQSKLCNDRRDVETSKRQP